MNFDPFQIPTLNIYRFRFCNNFVVMFLWLQVGEPMLLWLEVQHIVLIHTSILNSPEVLFLIASPRPMGMTITPPTRSFPRIWIGQIIMLEGLEECI